MKYITFEKICENWDGFVCLYGAGLIGKTWGHDIIVASGLKPDFYCDKRYGRNDLVNEIRVVDISYLEEIPDKVMVFLTLKEEFHAEVRKELLEHGIKNIVEMGDSFLQEFMHSIEMTEDKSLYEKYECIIDDRKYLEKRYEVIMGYKINLDNPKTFNEKIQWLKLYDRNPLYTTIVDKYAVKEYVAKIIGSDHIIPTLGVWNRFDDIDFESLPNQFVLKCTHDSGGIVVCKNKEFLNFEEAKNKLEKCLMTNFYLGGREWPYKNVKPRIIAEKYISEGGNTLNSTEYNSVLKDYKIHCFNGEPRFIQCICERNQDNHSAYQRFFSIDWEDIGWTFEDFPRYSRQIKKPDHLSEMINAARKVAKNYRYVRVDFYDINKAFLFGEITLFPLSGMYQYKGTWDKKRDLQIGGLIQYVPE